MNDLMYALWIIALNRRNRAIFIPGWGWMSLETFDRINAAMEQDARDLEESRRPW